MLTRNLTKKHSFFDVRFAVLIIAGLMMMGCANGQQGGPAPISDKSPPSKIRLATFNIAMGIQTEGGLSDLLAEGDDLKLQQVAEILQRVRPDIVVLSEFDYDPTVDAPALFNENYLSIAQNSQKAIHYPYHYRASVNTGVDSGLDLNGNGVMAEPNDAWGYGIFPGQYAMLILSQFPLKANASRTFQRFLWDNLPDARRPVNPDGSNHYPDEIWRQLRLSSKSHWDLTFDINDRALHLLAFHPTPPVFDGPEDRNGLRNFDEIRLMAEYLNADTADFIVDDNGVSGGLAEDEAFVIAGDFNSDPIDSDSLPGSINQLLQHRKVDSSCLPASEGAIQATLKQGGINDQQKGNPAYDTSDFNDEFTGNYRLDYVLPSKSLKTISCGVFWPSSTQAGHELVEASDHRLVWLDLEW